MIVAGNQNPRTVGVVVGRFQTHKLTDAHQYLLSQVVTRVPRVLVLLGCPPFVGKKRDPLEFLLRDRMVTDYWQLAHPTVPLTVLPCLDCPTDEEWARRIDQMIDAVNIGGPAILFCGPDGAGPIYRKAGGKHPVEVLDAMGSHATVMRAGVLPRHTEDFRAGVVYAHERRFVNPFQCVDVVVFEAPLDTHEPDPRVAAIQKAEDGVYWWRLVGGFVDRTDTSLEHAAKREVSEETGLEVGNIRYAGSLPIADWRYRGGPEQIMTAVFTADYVFGSIKAADDAAKAQWLPVSALNTLIHPIHKDAFALALASRTKGTK